MAYSSQVPMAVVTSNQATTAVGFVDIFITNLVKKFRLYVSDDFSITILGIKSFVETDNLILLYLFQQLSDCGFEIKIEREVNDINSVDVVCYNISKNESYCYNYLIQSIVPIIELSSNTGIPAVGIIIMQIVAQTIIKQKILYKAIVLDLDGTLWSGTLAEDGIDTIKNNLNSPNGSRFISLMNFVKTLAKELGIYIAICSRNDFDVVKSALEELNENIFPLRNQIDCLVANYNDKSDNITEISQKLSILPESIVFVDDNPIVRDEVRRNLDGVFVPEWSQIEDVKTQLLVSCIFERNELSISAQKRRLQFEIIQAERLKNDLPSLFVKVYDDDNHSEAKRLYAKSNQFKLTDIMDFNCKNVKSIYFELFCENGDSLGICSALTYHYSDNYCSILNWAISCRFFEIGLEEFVITYFVNTVVHKDIHFACQFNNKNKRICDWIGKYYGIVFTDSCDSIPYDDDDFINQFDYDLPFRKLLINLRNGKNSYSVCWIYSIDTLKNKTNLKLFTNNKMDKQKIFTIGYTLFADRNGIDLENMFAVLRSYGVSYLADVRSVPYSKQYPQCNSNVLKTAGEKFSVPYIHIPELGAKASPEQDVFSKASEIFFDDIFPIAASNRPEKTKLNIDDEIVDFQKFRNDEFFNQGIKRVQRAYDKNFTLALMCSEKEPINCHRYFLVSRKLEQCFGDWLEVEHIVKNKSGEITTVSNSQLNEELERMIFAKDEVKKLNLMQGDLTGRIPINDYFGKTIKEKQADFCDRYWNLMHGWKKVTNNQNNYDYD